MAAQERQTSEECEECGFAWKPFQITAKGTGALNGASLSFVQRIWGQIKRWVGGLDGE